MKMMMTSQIEILSHLYNLYIGVKCLKKADARSEDHGRMKETTFDSCVEEIKIVMFRKSQRGRIFHNLPGLTKKN